MRCQSAASRKATKGDLVGVDWQAVSFTRLNVRLTWILFPSQKEIMSYLPSP